MNSYKTKKQAVFNSLLLYSIQLPFVKISVNTYRIFFSYNLKKNNEEKYDILTIGCDKPYRVFRNVSHNISYIDHKKWTIEKGNKGQYSCFIQHIFISGHLYGNIVS